MYAADPGVLNDGVGLEKATVDIITGANMHLLSVRSHQLQPMGVSVTATISESHLTIHTWPEHGVALVDLFTCGDGADMLAILPTVVEKYGGTMEHTRWSLVQRGQTEISDLDAFLASRHGSVKKQVEVTQSKYQKIDVGYLSRTLRSLPRSRFARARLVAALSLGTEALCAPAAMRRTPQVWSYDQEYSGSLDSTNPDDVKLMDQWNMQVR